MNTRQRVALGVLLALTGGTAQAGGFMFAGETYGVDLVAHARGYNGSGASLNLNVCIETTSSSQAALEVPLRNAIAHWNQMVAGSGNLRSGTDNQIGASEADWESVMMHELGHCIGLAHPNLATESGLGDPDANYTKATDGTDNIWNLVIGADGVRGSSDDTRGDDINLHWYRRGVNHPFRLGAPPFDGSTFARDLAFLPPGHSFAANADRSVGVLLGYAASEAVMQQGQLYDEDQRTLTADDVATLRLARAGSDRVAGTSDDYTVTLNYGGVSDSCDITATLDATYSGFAVCSISGSFLAGNNIAITSARMRFNPSYAWHFSAVRVPDPVADSISVASGGTATSLVGGATSLLANDSHPNGLALVLSTSAYPGPVNGSVTLNANGTFSYTHNGSATSSDEFVYRTCTSSNANACSQQRVAVTITAGGGGAIFKDGFE